MFSQGVSVCVRACVRACVFVCVEASEDLEHSGNEAVPTRTYN